ncbi:hypothetical protein [Parahalioglobus pacificus]|uniref:IPTL-CTERM protein sorting domain-containing protein n=1 Tax=Parahalioglobus pacificus TaxID=930806 RepID=A0A918XHL4_9GAMM|nr:hypothetical protein [Halioglobus pacificus]GHD32064.1 hypothetical protein GCM10007053_15770 [Halioglobus pacificus]
MQITFKRVALVAVTLCPISAAATCDVTGATPEGGQVVICAGSEPNGFVGTLFRDRLSIFPGAFIDRAIAEDTIQLGAGNDSLTMAGGEVSSLENDCIGLGDDADTAVLLGGTLLCGDDGVDAGDASTVAGGNQIELRGATIVSDGDGIDANEGDDTIIMSAGSITVTGGRFRDYGIAAEGGNDSIVLSGGSITVPATSGAAVSAGNGSDRVDIAGPIALNSIINGDEESGDDGSTDTLRFSLTVPGPQADLVRQALNAASSAAGSVDINGRTYRWQNFERIEVAISDAAAPVPINSIESLLVLLLLCGFLGVHHIGRQKA